MNYVLDDIDLERLEYYIDKDNYIIHGWIDCIRATQLVKEIASGRVNQASCYYEDGAMIDDENVTDLLGGYENENIKLFVQRKDR